MYNKRNGNISEKDIENQIHPIWFAIPACLDVFGSFLCYTALLLLAGSTY